MGEEEADFPDSSNIRSGKWIPERKVIEIVYNGGGRYAYSDCTESEWDRICEAMSTGKAVNRILKESGKSFVKVS